MRSMSVSMSWLPLIAFYLPVGLEIDTELALPGSLLSSGFEGSRSRPNDWCRPGGGSGLMRLFALPSACGPTLDQPF